MNRRLLFQSAAAAALLCFSRVHGTGHQVFGYRTTADEVTLGVDLDGRTALVTGCSAGIGYETTRVLAMRGATVFALARTIEKATETCDRIAADGNKGKVTPFACEHTNFDSIVECVRAVKRTGKSIDILICNAGVYLLPKLELAHGLEQHFVINHLSHFILVNGLLEQVKQSASARIVIVGSDAYKMAPANGIDFDNLAGQKYYDPEKMYGQSKLANGLFALELARRLNGSRATANVAHPGWVMTDTMKALVSAKGFDEEVKARAKTIQQGAATPTYVACHPDVAGITGAYFEDCTRVFPERLMRDEVLARELWRVSEALVHPYLQVAKIS